MSDAPGVAVRRLAVDALVRIDTEGAYANLVLGPMLERSGLDERDRGLATELVYGTTRRRRTCDWLVDRFTLRDTDPRTRAALRLGAYQLAFTDVPAHAAVAATVGAVPKRTRGFVNAVLRRVADAPGEPADAATRLSYPDWVVQRLVADLGESDAVAALGAMNEPATVHRRPDGYVQDPASTWVAELVGARSGERVVDLCAAPGGKATALAHTGAAVVAADVRPGRAALVVDNARTVGASGLWAVAGDAARPPFRPGSFDRVLLDAPCSGLGVLRRRPDARWRVEPDAVDRLATLQRHLVDAAVPLVRPGGVLVYSVCTLTRAETLGIDQHLADAHPELEPLGAPGAPWRPWGRGGLVLPHDAGTDGMFVLRLRAPGAMMAT